MTNFEDLSFLDRFAQYQLVLACFGQQGAPTSNAWMESTVKEINYRLNGTEMFWDHLEMAQAILQARAATLSVDEDRFALQHSAWTHDLQFQRCF